MEQSCVVVLANRMRFTVPLSREEVIQRVNSARDDMEDPWVRVEEVGGHTICLDSAYICAIVDPK